MLLVDLSDSKIICSVKFLPQQRIYFLGSVHLSAILPGLTVKQKMIYDLQ